MRTACLALALVSGPALAADWTSYLCTYGSSPDAQKAQLIRVNLRERRVLVDERDKAAKFSETGVSFEGPPEIFWSVDLKSGKATVLARYGPPMTGTCREVSG